VRFWTIPVDDHEVRLFDAHPGAADLRQEVLAGFSARPRAIPPKFFYDERGSELFDRICELPEYYQTRTEIAILQGALKELGQLLGSECMLVELGSGASKKVRLLLEQLRPSAYVGVDISKEFLLSSTRALARDYPWLEVHAACVDFSAGLAIPHCDLPVHKVAFYPGSSIGNFDPDEAAHLLSDVAELVGEDGHLLIGVDLKKPVSLLDAAYNDAAGITAEFNLNLLRRIRGELDTDLDPESFEHYAFYNPLKGRIEMHLISRCNQEVRVEDTTFVFGAGEGIHTENSYKYTVGEFGALALRAGFQQQKMRLDDDALFSVQLLQHRS
jgi:dimethylhistidine N-methyltransferase